MEDLAWIDYIMSLLDWNRSITDQEEGIRLAGKMESIDVFLQPCNEKYNKNVWDNCAKILSERTDEELSPYLPELFAWLQDLNWPGTFCIRERLQKYADKAAYHQALHACLEHAKAAEDDVWENNLRMLQAGS